MGSRDLELRASFGSVAATYDSARPNYPEQLFDDLVELAGLRRGARLLEIGCGTGKATRPLLERGYEVDCVELSPALAEVARANLAGLPVSIHVEPFETWPGEPGGFDLVFAATAWHWLDGESRYANAAAQLAPRGNLAIWSAAHAFPEGFDPFFAEIQAVYDKIGESYPGEWPPPPPDEIADSAAEILGSGLFERPVVRRYVWEIAYTCEEYLALLDTFSGHIAMDADKRAHLDAGIRRVIGPRRVRRHWLAILHVARQKQR